MAWERRKGSAKAYYYYSIYSAKRSSQTLRAYLGPAGDPVAELAAAYDSLSKLEAEMKRRAKLKKLAEHRDRAFIAGLDVADAMMQDMFAGRQFSPPMSETESKCAAEG